MEWLYKLLQKAIAWIEKNYGHHPDVIDDTGEPAPTPAPEEQPTPTDTTATTTVDDLNLSDVWSIILTNTPGVRSETLRAAKVTVSITKARISGSKLLTTYTPYRWPIRDGVDAVCYLFYRDGANIRGGKFDWWRKGGQSSKTLENVHNGYGGHRMPEKGTPTWTMISSVDGSERSNTKCVDWA